MIFNPCALIPIYNHGATIRALVEALARFDLPILIVDDGSDENTQHQLISVVADFPGIRLFRLAQNGGKGAAVMHGMRQARQLGFSHALQIDADGQHDVADVPRFLAAGRQQPEAMIYGCPVYDASVPKGRLYGRYITDFWVRIETLSGAIADAMCGFRLYPLAVSCALIDRVDIPTRMVFDIEIMVRLAWEGIVFRRIDTRVTYPVGGISHFNMLRDNLRISAMHTRLTTGMLVRVPVLIWRRCFHRQASSRHWATLAERGSVAGLRFIFACYRLFGVQAARALLYPIVGYFFLTGRAARAASLDYLRRVRQMKGEPAPRWRDAFRHMLAFGQSGLDKLGAWLGDVQSDQLDFPARAELQALIDSGRGALVIGAHLGNLEMMRALATNERQAMVNAVVFTEHARRFNDLLKQANAEFGVNLIEVRHLGPETAILLREKIDLGELVVIVGDRTPPLANATERTCRVPFLGEEAAFAQGPFILASLLECPVYLLFCVRMSGPDKRYKVHFEHFSDRIELPRAERQDRLRQYIAAYATRLEARCLETPEQWFNFFDFWQAGGVPDNEKRP